jgi:hypothetical protein
MFCPQVLPTSFAIRFCQQVLPTSFANQSQSQNKAKQNVLSFSFIG